MSYKKPSVSCALSTVSWVRSPINITFPRCHPEGYKFLNGFAILEFVDEGSRVFSFGVQDA
jgi:hypothetical protein